MKKRDTSEKKHKTGTGLSADDEKKFNKLLNDVRALLTSLQASSQNPPSRIEYHTDVGGLGEHSEAKELTIKQTKDGGGTAPSQTVGKPVWEQVSKRRAKEGSYYEKAHLISRDFHGKGSKAQNIVPFYRGSNQKFEKDVESEVKKKAFGAGLPVRLDVKAQYNGSHHAKRDKWISKLKTLSIESDET